MAYTFAVSATNANRGTQVGSITPTGTYTTGGDTITAAQFGMNQLFSLDVNPHGGVAFEYIPTNPTSGKLKQFWTGSAVSSALAEVASANASMSGQALRYEAIGA